MHEDEHAAIARRIGARFGRPWYRSYARNKLRHDPAYATAAALFAGSRHDVLDIGCGLGLLGFYLRERGFAGEYRGLDFDRAKLAAARVALRGHPCGLQLDDGHAERLPPFHGHVALLDVLHYLPQASQPGLLADAAARVAPGASLIVRSVLRERGWRFRVTVWEERLLVASRWMRRGASHYPTREEIEQPLRAAGLEVSVRPLWGRTPFASFAIVGRRPY